MRIAFPAHVVRPLLAWELYFHSVCTWRLWNLPLSWFVYERIRLNLINPRVLKIERSLHVEMLDSALLWFDRKKVAACFEDLSLSKILRNHFLSENRQRNYVSFNVTLNYLMHEIMECCVTSFVALDNWEQKLLSNSWQDAKLCTPCAATTLIFPRENVNCLILCFTQLSVHCFFRKVCFLLPICLPCVICGLFVTKTNAMLDTARCRHSLR